jgi:hypothetical protein
MQLHSIKVAIPSHRLKVSNILALISKFPILFGRKTNHSLSAQEI